MFAGMIVYHAFCCHICGKCCVLTHVMYWSVLISSTDMINIIGLKLNKRISDVAGDINTLDNGGFCVRQTNSKLVNHINDFSMSMFMF